MSEGVRIARRKRPFGCAIQIAQTADRTCQNGYLKGVGKRGDTTLLCAPIRQDDGSRRAEPGCYVVRWHVTSEQDVLCDASPPTSPAGVPQMYVILQFKNSKYATALADGSCDNYTNVVQQDWIVTANDTQCTHEVGQPFIDMDEAKGE